MALVFVDIEVGNNGRIRDIAALRAGGDAFHQTSLHQFFLFISDTDYLCGHNIVHHDLKYIQFATGRKLPQKAIDTLYWAPLLFPKRPYHKLLKDDKLQVDELNNPLNDCKKAADLFYDELNAFRRLSGEFKKILFLLLKDKGEYSAFFEYCEYSCKEKDTAELIRKEFKGKLCSNADIASMVRLYPVELAYSLALIYADDEASITPPWILRNFPQTGRVFHLLRAVPCAQGCRYCKEKLNIHKQLRRIFGFSEFRRFGDEPLQEGAVRAAVEGKSLIAVFPTGGGKSLAFQLPALMAGRNSHALTVVISPLQSLMKDQVDNLNAQGIHGAVTVNGLLDPFERANSFERVSDGSASILYISPESLRSKTIEKILISRQIDRFVVDEAHCFSAWGQDFRVDYLYIAEFIRMLQKAKGDGRTIPVSCFTATAKQKVISDIRDYFKKGLGLDMELYATAQTRENLRYVVLHAENDDEKYIILRDLLSHKRCPAIVYVSRTRRSEELAGRLTADGITARAFHGKMEADEKAANQEAFMGNEVQVVVATSAFGMGVDKKDIGLVIHYDISSSLEDYVQESGRAGRDPHKDAECYVLYGDSDLDKHFLLLNQTKLSINEIQQVWTAIKNATKQRPYLSCSPLELARFAGWDDSKDDMETRVKTAVAALENAGYITRGRNMPTVYATGILARNMDEAVGRIDRSKLLSDAERVKAKRIIKSLISSRSRAWARADDAEARVDYLADMLGISTFEIVSIVGRMKQDGLLADTNDMAAYIFSTDTERKSSTILQRFSSLEDFLLRKLEDGELRVNIKELNEEAVAKGLSFSNVKLLRSLMYFLCIKKYIRKEENRQNDMLTLTPTQDPRDLLEKSRLRIGLCEFILNTLYSMDRKGEAGGEGRELVQFSVLGLWQRYMESSLTTRDIPLPFFEEALLYLSKIGAMRIEGGFIVFYNGMEIRRLEMNNKIGYKKEDYSALNDFYRMRMQQIHIVGEYANLMVKDMDAALLFVKDYFLMDYSKFIDKYFKGSRKDDLNRNITSAKYHQLFDSLSKAQLQIVGDTSSQHIVVAAGPGSGKTRILVHKLASLLLMEDVKHEQLLMLTFSRSAATEFKKRLIALVGGAAYYVDIKTFHSYCFDLLGKVGNLEESNDVVKDAVSLIRSGDAEQGQITKTVLVIDEAQDMDFDSFSLVCALMENNPSMRVIAVGDDDQNIYEFRGSSSEHLRGLVERFGAKMYELLDNYRSCRRIVELSNEFATQLSKRMKSHPIRAVKDEDGTVSIVRHEGENMEEAVVRQLISTRGSGSCCVLTETNDDALIIHSLLLHRGIQARLVQSLDGFRLINLVELRYFLKHLDPASAVISEDRWEEAKERLRKKYSTSTCLEICERLLEEFSATRKMKYYSDFKVFLMESKYEDFLGGSDDAVLVSTIHKAKGREFDKVYLMLRNTVADKDENKRALYVGMTRAKEALYIHCNTDLFASLKTAQAFITHDMQLYPKPAEIVRQFTHRGVHLDFFKEVSKDKILKNLRSGDSLALDLPYLKGAEGRVLKLSAAAMKEVNRLKGKGYRPYSASILFIVAWKGENDEQETPVILPEVRFRLL